MRDTSTDADGKPITRLEKDRMIEIHDAVYNVLSNRTFHSEAITVGFSVRIQNELVDGPTFVIELTGKNVLLSFDELIVMDRELFKIGAAIQYFGPHEDGGLYLAVVDNDNNSRPYQNIIDR